MDSRNRFFIKWAIFAVMVVFCAQIEGGVIIVDAAGTGDYPTIQAAIDAAAGGDEVVLEAGTYTGDGNRDIEFGGKAITVRSIDPDDPNVVEATVVYCEGSEAANHRGFLFASGEGPDSILSGLTITGGYMAGMGGAIYCNKTGPTIRQCVIIGNRTKAPTGTVSSVGGAPIIAGCFIMQNSAPGILSTSSDTTISNCVISRNEGQSEVGGIHTSGTDGKNVITNSTIVANQGSIASRGIGVFDTHTLVTNSIVQDMISVRTSDGSPPAIAEISYCNIEGGRDGVIGVSDGSPSVLIWGSGNIEADPCFAELGHWEDPFGTPEDTSDDLWVESDYHLKSQVGRWYPAAGLWVTDAVTSFCIDAGDPNSDDTAEPAPNVGGINIGVYGGTSEASKSFYEPQRILMEAQRLEFFAEVAEANPQAQVLSIRNARGGTLNWAIVEECDWLDIYPDAGHVTNGVNDVNIVVDIEGLYGGEYEYALAVTDPCAANSPQTVNIMLTLAPPIIELSHETFQPSVNIEDDLFYEMMTIRNAGAGVLKWAISEQCDWLVVEPNHGVSSGEVNNVVIRMDATGLDLGHHNCELLVTDEGAGLSPKVVTIDLLVFGDCLGATHPDFSEWLAMGKPTCWCIKTQCHGDTNGQIEGSSCGRYRVHFADLTTLLAAWNIKDAPKGPGITGDDPMLCADFDHARTGNPVTGYYRVHYNDLHILISNWYIKEPPLGLGIPRDCGGTIEPQ